MFPKACVLNWHVLPLSSQNNWIQLKSGSNNTQTSRSRFDFNWYFSRWLNSDSAYVVNDLIPVSLIWAEIEFNLTDYSYVEHISMEIGILRPSLQSDASWGVGLWWGRALTVISEYDIFQFISQYQWYFLWSLKLNFQTFSSDPMRGKTSGQRRPPLLFTI